MYFVSIQSHSVSVYGTTNFVYQPISINRIPSSRLIVNRFGFRVGTFLSGQSTLIYRLQLLGLMVW